MGVCVKPSVRRGLNSTCRWVQTIAFLPIQVGMGLVMLLPVAHRDTFLQVPHSLCLLLFPSGPSLLWTHSPLPLFCKACTFLITSEGLTANSLCHGLLRWHRSSSLNLLACHHGCFCQLPPKILSRARSLLSKTDWAQEETCAQKDKPCPRYSHPRNATTSRFVLGREPRGTQGHRDCPQPSSGESTELADRYEKQGDSSSCSRDNLVQCLAGGSCSHVEAFADLQDAGLAGHCLSLGFFG